MKKYVIERVVAGVGGNDQNGLSGIAHKSNSALAIREHARLSGFPANVITEVKAVIDPATAV
jgi:hypothetical protein